MSFDTQIIDFIKQPNYLPMKQHELAIALGLTSKGQRTELRHALKDLEERGLISCLRKNRWGLPEEK